MWCVGIVGWPDTAGGQNATLPCSAGFSGEQRRLCTTTGEWSPVDDSQCGRLGAGA